MSDTSGAVLRGAVDLSSLRNRANAPAPGAPGAPAAAAAGGIIQDVTDATFQQIVELSRRVPVIVSMFTVPCAPCEALAPTLEKVIAEANGRLVLARVDIGENRQIGQAFGVQSVPAVVALVNGQPVPLFNDEASEADIVQILGQVLQLATQQGVTGSVSVDPAGEAAAEEIPPLHAEAYAAIEEGDYARAAAAYDKALAENPRDADARAGLGQVRLLQRVQGADLQAARAAAAERPRDVAAQFLVADLDVSGGHIDDAFGRLLDLFATLPADERQPVRERLVELFALVGESDERVAVARKRLTSLLF